MEEVLEKSTAVFGPEGVMMLSIFGIIDIIDFLIGSVLIMDIVATIIYFLWILVRSQTTQVIEAVETVKERRLEREEMKTKIKARTAKKGKWLRRILFVLEWIPLIGMIPGWTFIVYSELTS